MNSRINIFVVCHRQTYVLENSLLIPIQVGTALTDIRLNGMLSDNQGDNISLKNTIYCELTAQYWAWKNVTSDYYGFFHYRRYMSFEHVYSVNKSGQLQMKGRKTPAPYIEIDNIQDDLAKYRLEKDRMEKIISRYDLITVLRETINITVYRQYCQYHPREYLDDVLDILYKKYPNYTKAAKQYMESKDIYYMNMYIMKRELFIEYSEWLFDILGEYEFVSGIKNGETERLRSLGYVAERLFGIFYIHQRNNGIRCAETPYLKFYNTEMELENGIGKRNTTVGRFRLSPTKIEISVDMRILNKLFPAGSKRRILLRNIFLR